MSGAHRADPVDRADRVQRGGVATAEASLTVTTAEAMRALGARLALVLRAGDLVILSGDLGAGKTTLAQGVGIGLEVREPVTSPTFVIARVHPALGRGPALVHVDAFRLGSLAEVDDLDLDASLAESVTVVEWGQGMVEDLAPDRLEVSIRRPRGGADSSIDSGIDNGIDVGADLAPFDGDELRGVQITGYGLRWDGITFPMLVS